MRLDTRERSTPTRPGQPAGPVRLRVDLLGWPGVWRQVDVDPRSTLGDLHEVIMLVFDWGDDHLHLFEQTGIGGRRVRFSPGDWDLGQDGDEGDVAVAFNTDVLSADVRDQQAPAAEESR